MARSTRSATMVLVISFVILAVTGVEGQRQSAQPPDAVMEAQAPPRGMPAPTPPNPNDPLAARNAKPSSPAFGDQPDKGKIEGFDFFRDPLNAKKPCETMFPPNRRLWTRRSSCSSGGTI